MWNSERKSIKLTFARSLCPIVAAVLLSLSSGAVGQNAQSGALSAAGGDMRIGLKGAYEVSNLALKLNSKKCNVAVGRITFAPKDGVTGEECTTAVDPDTNAAITTLKLRGGGTVKLKTAFLGDRPIMQLDVRAVAG